MTTFPTLSDVQVEDAVLTDFGIARLQDPGEDFFSMQAAPPVGVKKVSGKYPVWNKGDLNRDDVGHVAPGELIPLSQIRLSNDSYNCDPKKRRVLIPDENLENEADSVDSMNTLSSALINKFLINMDRDFNTVFNAASVWTGSTTGSDVSVSDWTDTSGGTPHADLDAEIESVDSKGGSHRDQILFLDPTTFKALIRHPDFRPIFNGNSVPTPQLTQENLASLLGIKKVVVCRSRYTTSAEGAATQTLDRIWTDETALLLYVPEGVGKNTECAAKTFFWEGYSDRPENNAGLKMMSYRDEDRDATIVKGRLAWDHKVVSADLGSRMTGTRS